MANDTVRRYPAPGANRAAVSESVSDIADEGPVSEVAGSTNARAATERDELLDGSSVSPSEPNRHEAFSREVFQSYDLYQRLRDTLHEGVLSPDGVTSHNVVALIEELSEKHPLQFNRIYRDLQSGVISTAEVISSLSAEELKKLIEAIVVLTSRAGQSEPSDLLNAITSYAGRAADRKRYYSRILQRMLDNQVIDFEAIVSDDFQEKEIPPGRRF